eukprot:6704079-Prymnesium_polylepis.1
MPRETWPRELRAQGTRPPTGVAYLLVSAPKRASPRGERKQVFAQGKPPAAGGHETATQKSSFRTRTALA